MSVPPLRFDMPRGVTYAAGARRAFQRLSQSINAAAVDSDIGGGAAAQHLAKLYLSGDTAWSTPGYTDVVWDAESVDLQGWHDLVTNPSRITVASAGVYEITTMITWSSGAAVAPEYRVQKNGSTTYTQTGASWTSGQVGQSFTVVDVAAAGDYYTVGLSYVGGASTIKGGANLTWVCVKLIGGV